jgi:hypothetical protein
MEAAVDLMVRFADLRPALLAIPLIVATAAALRADPIPQTVLDDNLKSCTQSCTAAGKAAAQCNAYCSCSVNSIEEKFTDAEYSAMNSAVQAKQPIPKGSQDKLQAIVNACNAQTFK